MAVELSKSSPPEVFSLVIRAQQAVDAGTTSNQGNHMVDDIKRKIDHTKHQLLLLVDFCPAR